MSITHLVVAIACLAVCFGLELPGVQKLPSVWTVSHEHVQYDKVVNVKIALHPKDGRSLERKLIDIATPGVYYVTYSYS